MLRMMMALNVVLLAGGAHAGELTVRDRDGRRVGTVERSVVPGDLVARDGQGRRVGTIEDREAAQREAQERYRDTLRTISGRDRDGRRSTR